MSERGRGGRGRPPAEYRSYDDYDDAYATPRSRNGRVPHQYGGHRTGKFDVPPAAQPYYAPYTANGPTYCHPAWAQGRPSRAPYVTNQQHQHQHQYQEAAFEEQRALTERGTRWSGSGGGGGGYSSGRPHARPPSSTGGSLRQPSAGRSGAPGSTSAGGGRPQSIGGGGRQPSTGRGSPGNGSSSSGSGGSSGIHSGTAVANNTNTGATRPRSTNRAAAVGRARAPYVAPPEPDLAMVPAAAALAEPAASTSADFPMEPEAPSNPHFLTPAFPQPPRTRTDSCSTWALMVEASCQTLESVVGPFLEGVLIELLGEPWERELFKLDVSLPPFNAAACAELVSRCKQLHERLPITIHKRVEAVQKATAALAAAPASLEPEDVAAAHVAMKGMLQDCVKAIKMPSLLGAGSRQFRAFTGELLPHAESTLLYYDMLIADCSEAAAARQQARAAAMGEAAASSSVSSLVVASP